MTSPLRASIWTIFARYGAGRWAASAISLTNTGFPPAAAMQPSADAAYPTAWLNIIRHPFVANIMHFSSCGRSARQETPQTSVCIQRGLYIRGSLYRHLLDRHRSPDDNTLK